MSTMILAFAVLVSLLVTSCNGDCQANGCGAICGDTHVNLATVIQQPYDVDDNQDVGYKFTLDFCNGVDNCKSDNNYTAAVCQFYKDDLRRYFELGSTNNPAWGIDTDGNITVTFQNGRTPGDGTTRQTIVKFIKQVGNTQVVYNGVTGSTFSFTITASDLAPVDPPMEWVKWIVISLSVIAVIICFIAGAFVLCFITIARRVEIIPNWKSRSNPCRGRSTCNYEKLIQS